MKPNAMLSILGEPRYLIVTGKGKTRKVIASFYGRNNAIACLNICILDNGTADARLVVKRNGLRAVK